MKSRDGTYAYQVPFYIGSSQLTKLVFEVRGAAGARYFLKRSKARKKQFAFYAKSTCIAAVWCQPLDASELVGESILTEMLPEDEYACSSLDRAYLQAPSTSMAPRLRPLPDGLVDGP